MRVKREGRRFAGEEDEEERDELDDSDGPEQGTEQGTAPAAPVAPTSSAFLPSSAPAPPPAPLAPPAQTSLSTPPSFLSLLLVLPQRVLVSIEVRYDPTNGKNGTTEVWLSDGGTTTLEDGDIVQFGTGRSAYRFAVAAEQKQPRDGGERGRGSEANLEQYEDATYHPSTRASPSASTLLAQHSPSSSFTPTPPSSALPNFLLKRWTKEEDDHLRAARVAKKTHKVVAEELGRSESSVQQRWYGKRTGWVKAGLLPASFAAKPRSSLPAAASPATGSPASSSRQKPSPHPSAPGPSSLAFLPLSPSPAASRPPPAPTPQNPFPSSTASYPSSSSSSFQSATASHFVLGEFDSEQQEWVRAEEREKLLKAARRIVAEGKGEGGKRKKRPRLRPGEPDSSDEEEGGGGGKMAERGRDELVPAKRLRPAIAPAPPVATQLQQPPPVDLNLSYFSTAYPHAHPSSARLEPCCHCGALPSSSSLLPISTATDITSTTQQGEKGKKQRRRDPFEGWEKAREGVRAFLKELEAEDGEGARGRGRTVGGS
ncbi:hypothetical protein JCM8547_008934 [Rhodosporidiobolus lusitaniae]